MIFERAARREFAQAAAGTSIALVAILTSTNLIRLLKQAAGGQIAPEAVMSLLGFAVLGSMPILLSLTLFVSILLTLSRVYRDSEMVVWLSSGQPLTAWVKPVLRFALPILLAITVLSTSLSPWAFYSTATYKEQLSARSDVSQVAPGAFRENSQGNRVVFVEALADDASRVGNVFVANMQDGKLGVVMARDGTVQYGPSGDRFVVLEKGRRYEVVPGSPEFKVMNFDRYQVLNEDAAVKPADMAPARMSLLDLLEDQSLRARGELLWRLGLPFSSLVLALLAIPLSYINPRAGRSANLMIAVLVYAIYSNLLSLSNAWVSQGKLPFWIGVWAVHAFMMLPVIWLFYFRSVVRWSSWKRKVVSA